MVLNRDGGLTWERGGLFNLEKTMVLVLHKELDYKVEKLKYKKLKVIAAENQKINKPRVGKDTIPDQSTRSFNY